MLFSLAIIIILALILSQVFLWFKLPGLLGMLAAGMLLGPFCADFIAPEILQYSGEIRLFALIIILIRAGLGINRKALTKIGAAALKMSIIPCLLEAFFIILATLLLLPDFSLIYGGILAFILAAVSPAIIVPQMLDLKEKGLGKLKEIPTLILASASIDDIFAISFFYLFIELAQNKSECIASILFAIPAGIFLAVCLGVIIGIVFVKFFQKFNFRDTKKALAFCVIAILLCRLEQEKFIPFAALLSIMVIGFVILEKNEQLAYRLAVKFNKIWILVEILLFVLIGAAVNIKIVPQAGFIALLIITIGLCGRSLGVFLSLRKSELNSREKLFCIFAYFPKATVQAAIGAIPLSLGLAHGELILAVAVLAIIITAPLGSILIHFTAGKLLQKE